MNKKRLPLKIRRNASALFAGETGMSGPETTDFFAEYGDHIRGYWDLNPKPGRRTIFENCLESFPYDEQIKILLNLCEMDNFKCKYGLPIKEERGKFKNELLKLSFPKKINKEEDKSESIKKESQDRKYYSVRTGKVDSALDLDSFKEVFQDIYEDFCLRGYFDEHFGYNCVDGKIPGKVGSNVEGYVLRKLRKNNLWPILEKYKSYLEVDLFDMIEFLFDHISRPLEKDAYYHSYNDCGFHYKNFDSLSGQIEFVNEINQFLKDYGGGYKLNLNGEIFCLAENPEMQKLIDAPIPQYKKGEVDQRIKEAVRKFQKYGSTLTERREAIRALADCLEYLRPKTKTVLTNKDEDDLFNIANNFGIRHHNDRQKTNYDKNIWLSWMFYFYLATLHVCLRLINKQNSKNVSQS